MMMVLLLAHLYTASATALPLDTVVQSSNATVYIIRHGEKTFAHGCLNIQGQERANNMGNVFNGKESATHATFKTPKTLFANNYHDGKDCERCWLTVQQRARQLNLTTIHSYGFPSELGGNEVAANAIKAEALRVGVVLVSWEHVNIKHLAAYLGVAKSAIPHWKKSDYDSVYVIDFDIDTGDVVGFAHEHQNYIPKSTTCPPNYKPPPNMPGQTAQFAN